MAYFNTTETGNYSVPANIFGSTKRLILSTGKDSTKEGLCMYTPKSVHSRSVVVLKYNHILTKKCHGVKKLPKSGSVSKSPELYESTMNPEVK